MLKLKSWLKWAKMSNKGRPWYKILVLFEMAHSPTYEFYFRGWDDG